ncbi:GNAT family N-acetyltransferase [Paenibacillus qinlingensis]|uniref:GNAT superfamily N-acetyltransferase n=1 Tax=Paenibacillus qinlingensis TaxID=1837343 RepID=A0ABU1NX52_9BACL|nr:GNAT family N-acetyltransferase [Paenibacillus qinlingensis]MDR6552038.1 GNAT superfamily N-acetyltransferase [Paenibacillus qinlingensis]
MEYRTIDVEKDRETIIAFRKDSYVVSFGSEEGFGDEDEYVRRIADRARRFPEGLVLIEDEDRPVGQLELQIVFYEGSYIGYANLFYLIPSYRGKGYGRQLIAYAEGFFEKYAVKSYHLRVAPTNARALHLYENCGFRLLEKEEDQPHPVWRMVKDL